LLHEKRTPASGYAHGVRLAAEGAATAVFVANDQMALGLIRAYTEAGLSVPGDVSVVGFDDIPEAAFFSPPLTTVRQDFTVLGRAAMETVLAVLGERDRDGDGDGGRDASAGDPGSSAAPVPDDGTLGISLVERASTAPPAGAPGALLAAPEARTIAAGSLARP
jgi:ABC-type sugar transport system substrate-binding protein